jgi:hypothetical protein
LLLERMRADTTAQRLAAAATRTPESVDRDRSTHTAAAAFRPDHCRSGHGGTDAVRYSNGSVH